MKIRKLLGHAVYVILLLFMKVLNYNKIIY